MFYFGYHKPVRQWLTYDFYYVSNTIVYRCDFLRLQGSVLLQQLLNGGLHTHTLVNLRFICWMEKNKRSFISFSFTMAFSRSVEKQSVQKKKLLSFCEKQNVNVLESEFLTLFFIWDNVFGSAIVTFVWICYVIKTHNTWWWTCIYYLNYFVGLKKTNILKFLPLTYIKKIWKMSDECLCGQQFYIV